jgi:hypothetical protein
MSRLSPFLREPLLRAAAAVLGIGWTPLLLYVGWEAASGAKGGNPIGLGLLFFFSTPLALALALSGVVRLLARERAARRS